MFVTILVLLCVRVCLVNVYISFVVLERVLPGASSGREARSAGRHVRAVGVRGGDCGRAGRARVRRARAAPRPPALHTHL